MNIEEQEEDLSTVDRVEFCRDLVDGVIEGLEESFELPLRVVSVANNHVVYSAGVGEGTNETVNINDQDDLELLFATYVIIGSATLTMPKIIVHFSEDEFESTGEYVVDGLELHDFAGQVITAGSTVGTLKVELGANYLRNLLRLRGVISTSKSDPKPRNLIVFKSESCDGSENEEGDGEIDDYIDEEVFDELYDEVFEADGYSLSSLRQRQKTKAKRLRARDLARRADPMEFKKRSRAAKLRWRKNRTSILRGMRKFHRSAQGKRLHNTLGKLNEN